MKKWLIGIGSILIVALACIYLFIPSTLVVSRLAWVKCNPYAASRRLSMDAKWKKLMSDGQLTILSRPDMDSSILQWRSALEAGPNPFHRISQYRAAKRVRAAADSNLAFLRTFLERKENIYGMNPQNVMSKDSSLVVMQWTMASYPSTQEIYQAIGTMRSYIKTQGAKEIDPPMLHVNPLRTGGFEVMAAIPVNMRLKGSGKIFPRQFVPWKIISAEVKGGVYTAEQAMAQLQNYMLDYRLTAMAMPFQSLVTDRDQEQDTSKWVTRVIVPVPTY